MKNILFAIVVFFLVTNLHAFQSDVTRKIDGKDYNIYKVEAGDGWYGIARKFNITYAELRLANKNTSDKLAIGQEVLVPADKLKANDPYFDKNYTNKKEEPVKKTIRENPVHHTVAPSQTLYSISRLYHITVDELKAWNNLSSNSISTGQVLVVSKGGNDVKEINPSSLAVESKTETITTTTTGSVPKAAVEEVKKEAVVTTQATEPVETAEEKTEVVKEIVPVTQPSNALADEVAKSDITGKAPEETKPSAEQEVIDTSLVTSDVENISYSNDSAQANSSKKKKDSAKKLKKKLEESIEFGNGRVETTENGTAEILTEEPGNQEKYYALHTTAPVGTVVRVLNMTNSRKMYVKVIGKIPEGEENEGLLIKLSKPCADKLGEYDSRFQVNLLYGLSAEGNQ